MTRPKFGYRDLRRGEEKVKLGTREKQPTSQRSGRNRGTEEYSRIDEEIMVSKGKPVALKKRSTARCLHPSRRPADIQMLSTSTSTSLASKTDQETLTTEFDASRIPQPFLDPDLRDRMLNLRESEFSTATHTIGQNNE
ncbi:hypothetical protein A7D00_2358 [Trichophyton violaceum]|uniref:Uncharacterized protein n=1 Tax=Trichophyton violaceum TaxID=34388 RepID=A0A178FR45_TRIVO|nr:hypothetical protein A7D00_2358 [Trichophyton violaceum]